MESEVNQSPWKRTYLGDGLYAEYDGYQFMLAANNGISDTDVVYLDPSVLAALMSYVQECGFGLVINKAAARGAE